MAQGRAGATTIYYEIRLRIKELRIKAGITQVQLATQLGVSPVQVCKLERGIHKWSVANILEAAKLFGVSSASIIEPGFVPTDVGPRERAVGDLVRSFNAMSAERQKVFLEIGRLFAE